MATKVRNTTFFYIYSIFLYLEYKIQNVSLLFRNDRIKYNRTLLSSFNWTIMWT